MQRIEKRVKPAEIYTEAAKVFSVASGLLSLCILCGHILPVLVTIRVYTRKNFALKFTRLNYAE